MTAREIFDLGLERLARVVPDPDPRANEQLRRAIDEMDAGWREVVIAQLRAAAANELALERRIAGLLIIVQDQQRRLNESDCAIKDEVA